MQVNGTEMPSGNGAEQRIHAHIGEIKNRDERIVIRFKGITTCLMQPFKNSFLATHVTTCCTVPSGDDVTLTFESFVTKSDLKRALRQHEALGLVLGVSLNSDEELDALFDKYDLDSDHDSAIIRGEWRVFVERLHAAAMALKQAHRCTRALACKLKYAYMHT